MSELQVDLTHAGVPSAELQSHAASLGKALAALDETPAGDFLRIVHSPAVLREIRACAFIFRITSTPIASRRCCEGCIPSGPWSMW